MSPLIALFQTKIYLNIVLEWLLCSYVLIWNDFEHGWPTFHPNLAFNAPMVAMLSFTHQSNINQTITIQLTIPILGGYISSHTISIQVVSWFMDINYSLL